MSTASEAKHMTKKLKIAIFHLAFIYSGGGEKLVLQEYDGLKKKGYEVEIFTTVIDRKKCFPEIIDKYKIRTFLPNFKVFKGHEAFQTVFTCVVAPFYAFKFINYDLILACNQPSPWIAYIINKMYGVPYLSYLAQATRFLHPRKIDKETGLFFTKHDSESLSARLMMTTFRQFSNWADQLSVRGSNMVLTNGEYIKKVIEKIYKIKAISCPSGVVNPRNVRGKREDYLLVSNRHFAQKKIEYAIFALNSILAFRPKYRLLITGLNTEYTYKLKDLVRELGIEKNVEFLGYVDEKQLNNLYRRASVYLYTAPEEDFGMGIIEAMRVGTPVVAWNSCGPSKIIENGETGYLAKPFSTTDFTEKVLALITNKKMARRIGKNSYNKVKKDFSLKRHIDTIEESLIKFAK